MRRIAMAGVALVVCAALLTGCDEQNADKRAAATDLKVREFKGSVQVDPNSRTTVEQRNIQKRLTEDNRPGGIKHLYVVSSYSGQVIFYSTVAGKVTSSGKRLQPYTKFRKEFGNHEYLIYEEEALQDDGTYGTSIDYLYWWDSQGRYHQHYVSGGQIIHISDQPLAVKSVTINLNSGGR